MSVTIKMIAEMANVSMMTVSRVLSRKETNMVSDAVREKILEIAKAHNYRPNRFARALRTGNTPIVVLALHKEPPLELEAGRRIDHGTVHYLYNMLNCFSEEFQKYALEMLFVSYSTLEELKSRLTMLEQDHFISGIIVNMLPNQTEEQAVMLNSLGVPCVTLGDSGSDLIPCTIVSENGIIATLREIAAANGARDVVRLTDATPEQRSDPGITILVHGEYNYHRALSQGILDANHMILYSTQVDFFLFHSGYIFDPLLAQRAKYTVELLQDLRRGRKPAEYRKFIVPGKDQMRYCDPNL